MGTSPQNDHPALRAVLARPGEVLHFSEDPSIEQFIPHRAATAQQPESYVWAVDGPRSPDYWFPRQCPRAMAWVGPRTTQQDRDLILGPGGGLRVHAVEHRWLRRIAGATLFVYRLPAQTFRPISSDDPYAVVSTEPVSPLAAPDQVDDLLVLHDAANIQLRLFSDVTPFWSAVTSSTLEFSGIRLRNLGGPDVG